MHKLQKWLHMNDKGFTLVELMVAVVIIGILVAIAIPLYNDFTIRAEQATLEANLRIIDSAIASYYAFSKNDVNQGYEGTLLSLPAVDYKNYITQTALVLSEPDLPNALSEVEDLVKAGFLTAAPTGPDTVIYGITGEAPNQKATATGTIGRDNFFEVTLNELPWKKEKTTDFKTGPVKGTEEKEDEKRVKPVEPALPKPAPFPERGLPIPMPSLPEPDARPFY